MPRWLSLFAVLALASACSGPEEPAGDTFPPAEVSSTPSTTAPPAVASTSTPVTVPPVTTAPSTTIAGTAPADPPEAPPETSQAPPTTLAPLRSLAYREVATVPFPIDLAALPGTDVLVIASKEGRLWLYEEGGVRDQAFLDIRERVRDRGEQGLLGVAFSPDYPDSGRLFVHYTALDGDTVLAEYTAAGGRVDPGGEMVLLRIDQPAPNHNGGTIAFGPDGYLYMGLGDGGGAGDRFDHGQNDRTPLGALLRLDVSAPGAMAPAPGNPFPAPEVWAIGLRNPWRFTIDHPSGLVVIADVGQNHFEEVSVAPVAEPGLNYGWPITEGLHCFRPESGCDATGLTLPVLEVSHNDSGTCSITGGVVYRGAEIPELYGHYLFSDYCGGYLRSFPLDDPGALRDWTDQIGTAGQVTAFGADASGEVYVLTASGSVLRLEAER